jgi:hypothetical protein
MTPTRETVLEAIEEFDRIGKKEFLRKYASGADAQVYRIFHNWNIYPMKAIWAAAYRPTLMTRDFSYKTVKIDVQALGFKLFDLAEQFKGMPLAGLDIDTALIDLAAGEIEGKRVLVEIERVQRSAAIVARVKARRPAVCEACGFDFGEVYGPRGKGYIECHHIDPLSGREGVADVTKESDLALLCANCHRMVHRYEPCLTIDELKDILLRG